MAATLDPAHTVNGTLSNGNLTVTATVNNCQSNSTNSYAATGKYHLEFTVITSTGDGSIAVGLVGSGHTTGVGVIFGQDATGYALWSGLRSRVQPYFNGVNGTAVAQGFTQGDTVAIEIDFGAQLLWYQNLTAGYNQWNGSGTANPTTGVGGLSYAGLVNSPYFFCLNPYSTPDAITINFGATGFVKTPSSGFQAWNQGTAPVVTAKAAALMVGV